MPKLLQINSFLNSGSAGRIVEQIGELAIQNGWESYVAYGRKKNDTKSQTIKIGGNISILLHGFISLVFDKHGLGSSFATKRLIRKIEKLNPDIIHLHGIHGYYVNYEVLFSYLNRVQKPVVWTMHDFWAITGHCTYFSDINCNKWLDMCFNCPKSKNYPKSIFFDRSKKNFLLKKDLFNLNKNLSVVSVSEWMGNLMKKSFLKNHFQETILNGVDVYNFSPKNPTRLLEKFNLKDKFILLGVATSWGERKGWNDFIELNRLLSDKYQIILVGLNENLQKKLPKNIIGLTRTESISELAELYSAADVVLSLSTQETFGLTTIEGFACGTPGIVYNCTASPELVTPDTGFIVEKGDFDGLLNALNEIKSKGKKFYSEKCRDRAVKIYDKNLRFREYIELYSSLIEK